MNFKETINAMLENGEFEKIIQNTKGRDKKAAQEFYGLVKDNKDLKSIPSLTLILAIRSETVLKTVICIMETAKDLENKASMD